MRVKELLKEGWKKKELREEIVDDIEILQVYLMNGGHSLSFSNILDARIELQNDIEDLIECNENREVEERVALLKQTEYIGRDISTGHIITEDVFFLYTENTANSEYFYVLEHDLIDIINMEVYQETLDRYSIEELQKGMLIRLVYDIVFSGLFYPKNIDIEYNDMIEMRIPTDIIDIDDEINDNDEMLEYYLEDEDEDYEEKYEYDIILDNIDDKNELEWHLLNMDHFLFKDILPEETSKKGITIQMELS